MKRPGDGKNPTKSDDDTLQRIHKHGRSLSLDFLILYSEFGISTQFFSIQINNYISFCCFSLNLQFIACAKFVLIVITRYNNILRI